LLELDEELLSLGKERLELSEIEPPAAGSEALQHGFEVLRDFLQIQHDDTLLER